MLSDLNAASQYLGRLLFLRTASIFSLLGVKIHLTQCNSGVEKLRVVGEMLSKFVDDAEVMPQRIIKTKMRHVLQENKPNVIMVSLREQMIDTLTTLYAQRGHVPELYEVLFCNTSTTFGDLRGFILRAKSLTKHNQKNPLYCLVNVDLLTSQVQLDFVSYLHDLYEDASEFAAPLFLVGIAKLKDSHLLSFDRFNILNQFAVASPEELQSIYQQILDLNGTTLSVIYSKSPGSGKTTVIKSNAKRQKRQYVRISLNSRLSDAQLIKLLAAQTNTSDPILMHLNISNTANWELNFQLYQLIIVGRLSDKENEHYWLPKCLIGAELPNSSEKNGSLDKFFFFKHFTKLEISHLELNLASNQIVQRVCKFFRLYQMQNRWANDEILSVDKEPNLSSLECFQLLEQFLKMHQRNIRDESLISVVNFVKFLNVQLEVLQKSGLFHRSMLQYMANGDQVRNTVFKSLLQTAAYISEKNAVVENNKANIRSNKLWENDNHCMILFNYPKNGRMEEAGDLSLVYRKSDLVPERFVQTLQSQHTGNYQLVNYSALRPEQLLELLANIIGVTLPDPACLLKFALTLDNFLKMIAIYARIAANIPVLIMGHTGCGKTATISFLASLLNIKFFHWTIHGGITADAVVERLQLALKEAGKQRTWIFFDEINTADCMGLFKEIICDQSFQGQKIPKNIAVLAACNPYIVRKNQNQGVSQTGLVFQYKVTEDFDIQESLGSLVYRVHPLPLSMVEYVWDYGSLSSAEELIYFSAIVGSQLPGLSQPFAKLMVSLLVESHNFIRNVYVGDNAFVVSLRDANRTVKVRDRG